MRVVGAGLPRTGTTSLKQMAESGARARYDEHQAEVIATVPPERLLLWEPSDGWGPLCDRLGVPVPANEPAHANTADEFRSRFTS